MSIRSRSVSLHDDRPYETFQPPYYALRHRDPSRLKSLFTAENPYWQFDAIMKLEDNLGGVRSSFYFLNEQRLLEDRPPTEWIDPQSWKLYGSVRRFDPEIADVILLDDGDGRSDYTDRTTRTTTANAYEKRNSS